MFALSRYVPKDLTQGTRKFSTGPEIQFKVHLFPLCVANQVLKLEVYDKRAHILYIADDIEPNMSGTR